MACPVDAGAVLRDVNATDVQDPEVVAWTRDREEVVVTGRQDGMYAVIVADRDPASEASRWSLVRVSIMYRDGDSWVLGNRDYDHRPTQNDIDAFLRELRGPEPEKFVFKAAAR